MDPLISMLEGARFYGAKSQVIDSVEVIRRAELGDDLQLLILRVHHGEKADLYQVLIDASSQDVLSNPDVVARYGRGLAAGEPIGFGTLHGSTLPEGLDGPGTAISGEQSNTSLIFGDTAMVKVFRHLEPGENPDVELLSQIPDCHNIAPVRGWVTDTIDGQEYTLAMVQDFVPDADDGWRYALGFSGLGASFGPEAHLLGEATHNVHRALEKALPVETISPEDLARDLEEHLEQMLQRAPILAEFAEAARSVYRSLPATISTPQQVQRVHGDLHLGQVLRTADEYILIDFEGEPARPLAQRRRPDSILRDLAGIIRSIDYAAHFHSHSHASSPAGPADPTAWVREATDAFLSGYGAENSQVLDAYVLDKALYEVVYEADNRPDWVDIPLAAVRRLLPGG